MGNSMRMATRCTLAWLPSRSRTTTTARPPHSSPASITTLASPSSTPRPSATLSVTCAKWSKLRTTALIWDTPWRRRKRKRSRSRSRSRSRRRSNSRMRSNNRKTAAMNAGSSARLKDVNLPHSLHSLTVTTLSARDAKPGARAATTTTTRTTTITKRTSKHSRTSRTAASNSTTTTAARARKITRTKTRSRRKSKHFTSNFTATPILELSLASTPMTHARPRRPASAFLTTNGRANPPTTARKTKMEMLKMGVVKSASSTSTYLSLTCLTKLTAASVRKSSRSSPGTADAITLRKTPTRTPKGTKMPVRRRKKLPKFARRSLKRAVHSDATPTLTSAQEPASPTLLRASTFQKLALPTARSRWSAMKNLWTVKAILCTHGTLSGSRPKEQAPAPRSGLLSWLLARLRLEFLPASTTERCHLQARAARDLPGKAEPWLKECARGGEAACARGVTVRESTMLNSIRNHNVLKGGGVGIWSLG